MLDGTGDRMSVYLAFYLKLYCYKHFHCLLCSQGIVMVQQLALLPHSKKVLVRFPGWVFLCAVCMLSFDCVVPVRYSSFLSLP